MEGWNWAAVRNSLQKQNDEFKRIITVTPHTYIVTNASLSHHSTSSLSTPPNVNLFTDPPFIAYSADRARKQCPDPQKRCPAPQHGAKVTMQGTLYLPCRALKKPANRAPWGPTGIVGVLGGTEGP